LLRGKRDRYVEREGEMVREWEEKEKLPKSKL
jgi:hypothetical protein